MSNLTASITSAGQALRVFQQALGVVQSNVDNASTAGYSKQTLNLSALPLDIAGGLSGGVRTNGLHDSRSIYAEEQVQRQNSLLGQYTTQAQSTDTLQSYFDVTGTSGVSSALNGLFQAFSAWSASPSDASAQQSVLNSAQSVAEQIQGLAQSLQQAASSIDGQVGSTVNQINTITAQIAKYNQDRLNTGTSDPASEAQLYSSLESLSQYVNFSTIEQSDGTVSVMLAGGGPLVLGAKQYALSSGTSVSTTPAPAYPGSLPTDHIYDANGNEVTSQITSGQLGGLLDTRNRVIAGILGDSQQQGTLNQFAQQLADTVNGILTSGTVSTATGAAAGAPLFTYDTTNGTNVAASFALNSSITADQLAGVDASGNVNGNANALAALATASESSLGGMSFSEYFGNIAAGVGQENQTATNNETTETQVVAQAKTMRDQVSGVSLDSEAVSMMQFQQAYQAVAQVLTTLNSLGDTLITMMQSAG